LIRLIGVIALALETLEIMQDMSALLGEALVLSTIVLEILRIAILTRGDMFLQVDVKPFPSLEYFDHAGDLFDEQRL
jgi:hypothetical protein